MYLRILLITENSQNISLKICEEKCLFKKEVAYILQKSDYFGSEIISVEGTSASHELLLSDSVFQLRLLMIIRTWDARKVVSKVLSFCKDIVLGANCSIS